MKKCPFCAEEIQDEAIKCKHCQEFLNGTSRQTVATNTVPWYFRTSIVVLALLSVGPLALPLIWWRPQTSRAWKIVLTIGILILTALCCRVMVDSIHTIKQYYDLMKG